ncbi:nitronate monooxygenase [Phytomonospora sp. NPDC050363]|uniref:nitronate monooxygenase n=1 Tax=Phytomonospora sp. NPDC050363 TaxID=3155642 RepID=UPI0033F3C7E6
MSLLSHLGIGLPVLAAPMAGGAGTPALVTAAARAGGLGFLAAGYRGPQELAEQIDTVRAEGLPFGVNVFAPNPVPITPAAHRAYADALEPEAARFGLSLAGAEPIEDDDHWTDKVDLLLASPVPLVSFTFGLPGPGILAALRDAGSVVAQTVTSADEARQAVAAGVDMLIVQAAAAGGHSATFTPERPPPPTPLPELVAEIARVVTLPLIAAGGVATAADARAALRAGSEAVMVGTVLLRTEESGAAEAHRTALTDPAFDTTVVTRAFTGRPARGLRNLFTDRYEPIAPLGYPAVHHLTAPLRKAAAAVGENRLMHLWAGTGHREARAEPAGQTLTRLYDGL